jgi:sec-independent protein translocase protein TatB
MFEVGFTELLLIFALSLIVLGPERLPKLAQQVGRWVGRARAMARQFRDQLDEEAHNLETKMNIDPGIDTSMDAKPKDPPTQASTNVPATVEPEPVEEFYPPDHHMHSSHRTEADSAPAPDADAGAVAEPAADPEVPRDDPSRPAP